MTGHGTTRRHARSSSSGTPYRKRATHACDRCRATKRRCDDHWPQCASCTRANVPCSRLSTPPTTGDPHMYIRTLENRCSGLESQLRLFEAARDRAPWSAPPYVPQRAPSPPMPQWPPMGYASSSTQEWRMPSPCVTPLSDAFLGVIASSPETLSPLPWKQFSWL